MPTKKSLKSESSGNIRVGDVSGGTGIAVGHGAQAIVTQGIQGKELAGLVDPLRKAVQEAKLPLDKKQEAENEVKSVEEELSKPTPNGKVINDRLMKLVALGGSVAVATMQLLQTPAIQALLQKALGK